jgi:AcrR family transcriptional regulator
MATATTTAFTSGRAQPVTPQGKDTRAVVIRAALAEFAQHGYVGARVEHITAQAGVGYGTFYKYFASKRDLVRAVLKDVYDDIFSDAVAQTHSSRPVAERAYLDFLASLRAFIRHRATLLALDSAVGADPELAAYLATLQQRDVDVYAQIISSTPGYRPIADPQLVSLAVNALGDEVARRWIRSYQQSDDAANDAARLEELARLLATMCVAVVAPEPAPASKDAGASRHRGP